VPHTQWQQITCVLLAVVAAISMGNAAGGAPRQPAALAQLLRAQELTSHLQKSEWLLSWSNLVKHGYNMI
jgi:hypothetical protein